MTIKKKWPDTLFADSVSTLSLYASGRSGSELISSYGYTRQKLREVSFFVKEHYAAATLPHAVHCATKRGDLVAFVMPPPRLTPRTHQVLCLVANGFTHVTMALEMKLEKNTVLRHQKELNSRFGTSSQCRLVYLGNCCGLL